MFDSPKAAVDSRGRLHVAWAEPASPDSLQGRIWGAGVPAHRLMYARFAPAHGWTAPALVYNEPVSYLRWRKNYSAVAVDAADRFHVLAMGVGDSSLTHLVVDDGLVHRRQVPARRGAFLDIAIDGSHIAVALTAWETAIRGGNVYVLRSLDGGSTWSTPQRIDASVQGNVQEVQVVIAQNGATHVVWAHNPDGGLWPATIRHVVSQAPGDSWELNAEVEVPNPFSFLRAVADACGGVSVIYAPHPQGLSRAQIGFVRWHDGEWESPTVPFRDFYAADFDVANSAAGDLALVAWLRPRNGNGEVGYRGYLSSRSLIRERGR